MSIKSALLVMILLASGNRSALALLEGDFISLQVDKAHKIVICASTRKQGADGTVDLVEVGTISDTGSIREALRSLAEARAESIEWFLHTEVFVIILDSDSKILSAFRYFSITRPDYGFAPVELQIEKDRFRYDPRQTLGLGYSCKALADLIQHSIPKNILWPKTQRNKR